MDVFALMRYFTIRLRMLGAIVAVLVLLGMLGSAGMFGMLRIHGMSEDFMTQGFAKTVALGELRGAVGAIRQHEKDMVIAYDRPDAAKQAHTQWLASLEQAKKVAGASWKGRKARTAPSRALSSATWTATARSLPPWHSCCCRAAMSRRRWPTA